MYFYSERSEAFHLRVHQKRKSKEQETSSQGCKQLKESKTRWSLDGTCTSYYLMSSITCHLNIYIQIILSFLLTLIIYIPRYIPQGNENKSIRLDVGVNLIPLELHESFLDYDIKLLISLITRRVVMKLISIYIIYASGSQMGAGHIPLCGIFLLASKLWVWQQIKV